MRPLVVAAHLKLANLDVQHPHAAFQFAYVVVELVNAVL
jgi:hypothetical protein